MTLGVFDSSQVLDESSRYKQLNDATSVKTNVYETSCDASVVGDSIPLYPPLEKGDYNDPPRSNLILGQVSVRS